MYIHTILARDGISGVASADALWPWGCCYLVWEIAAQHTRTLPSDGEYKIHMWSRCTEYVPLQICMYIHTYQHTLGTYVHVLRGVEAWHSKWSRFALFAAAMWTFSRERLVVCAF